MNKQAIIILIIIVIVMTLGIFIFIKHVEKNKDLKNIENINRESEDIYSKENKKDSVVLYFSATGTTKRVAEYIKEETDSNIIEIISKEKYTSDDLNYNKNCRANSEQNDINSRPEIFNTIDISDYKIIYLGYPIWWEDVPKIILTLLETTDFAGKTVIPFCTSGGSSITKSVNTLNSYKEINCKDGKTFNSRTTKEDVKLWINELNISNSSINKVKNEESNIDIITIKVNNEVLNIKLENNSSAKSFVEKLKEGDITVDAHDYSNFEKVGELGFDLPTNDTNIKTEAGDLILYQGNKIVLYYDTNTWNFTKIGKVQNKTQEELKRLLGDESVTLVFSI